MDKPGEPNAADATPQAVGQIEISSPANAEPESSWLARPLAPTAQQIVRRDIPRPGNVIRAPLVKISEKVAGAMFRRVHNSDDIIRGPVPCGDSDGIRDAWRRQIRSAKIAWGKLTEGELLETGGAQPKLAALVQERYSVSRDEAERQVRKFFRDVYALG
jgi:uncharacterized protein YjbJ (UPF0337 family)